jgi:multisubunit Na+/H+ antiporter MnhF subunit
MATLNVWYAGATLLLILLVPCVLVAVRGRMIDALVALEVATAATVVALLFMEQGMQRQTFFDVSLAMAVLTVSSTLLFARIYRRWL